MQKYEPNLKSDELHDVINSVPHWLTRWGIMVIFIAVVLLCVFMRIFVFLCRFD